MFFSETRCINYAYANEIMQLIYRCAFAVAAALCSSWLPHSQIWMDTCPSWT